MTFRLRLSAALLTLSAVPLLGAAGAHGQSLVGSGGLGIPLEPVDARAQALGGIGMGLSGYHILPHDPSAVGGLVIPTVTMTLQPSTGTTRRGDEELEAGGNRFPMVGVSYPVRENSVLLVTFGSFLDQSWQARTTRTVTVGGQDVEAEDTFRSEGGVSAFRVGWAQRLGADLSVALSVGGYTGTLERELVRRLDGDQVAPGVETFRDRAEWRVRAPTLTAGATWDASDLVRLGASVTWGGDLRFEPTEDDSDRETRSYPLPLQIRAGTTLSLASDLDFMGGVSYADWSDTGAALQEGSSTGQVWMWSSGVEWTGTAILGRPLPLRAGFRSGSLPFRFEDEDPTERAFSFGGGLTLAEADVFPLARADISLERVSREAGPVSESFWRTTLSFRLSGG